jgi:alkyl sulfatase BDS1-like metallo-beta-lactamase superfamily hydrolase
MLFDYLGVRLNGPKASGKKIVLNVDFTDLKKQDALTVENGVFNCSPEPAATADATPSMTKATLDKMQLKEAMLEQAVTAGDLKVEGKREAFSEFLGLLDTFPLWFNIVTP